MPSEGGAGENPVQMPNEPDLAGIRAELARVALQAAAALIADEPDMEAVERLDARAAELRARIRAHEPPWRADDPGSMPWRLR